MNDSIIDVALAYATPAQFAATMGLLVPLLVAFFTQSEAAKWVKTVLQLVLNAASAALAFLVTDTGEFAVAAFINAWVNAIIVSAAAYYGAYKPSGLAEGVNTLFPNLGLGKPPLPADEREDEDGGNYFVVTDLEPKETDEDAGDLSDAAADELVGSADEADPVELVEVDPHEAGVPPTEGWQADAHEEQYQNDPAVQVEGFDADEATDEPGKGA